MIKNQIKIILFSTLLLWTSISPVHAATISSTPAQTFHSIGGSGAWWPNDLIHFPLSTRQNLSSLLFSPSGLGLSSYRYNVGAGGVNVSNPTRAPETFYVSPGVYDFSKDAAGVYFLTQAASFGVQHLTMFANSAPAPLTSGKASCNGQFVTGTGEAYGTFLADVVQHFRGMGVEIDLISPMNEPDSSFGPSPCGQEGMQVLPSQRAEVVNGLFDALSARGLTSSVGIIADESSSLGNAENEYASWLPQVVDRVTALAHHTYDFPSDASYISYISSTNRLFPGKPTWMTEICCSLGNPDGTGKGYTEGYDPTIKNALMFSGMVFQSLVLANETHYDFWTLVSNGLGCSPLTNPTCPTVANSVGWNDGVIYYDPNYASNGNFNLCKISPTERRKRQLTYKLETDINKHFWAYKHFGNFVKPGSQRRPIIGSDASEFTMAVASTDTYYILAMNPSTSDSTLTLTFPDAACATHAFRTSASEDFVQIAGAVKSGSNWVLALKGTSLTTYAFDRVSC